MTHPFIKIKVILFIEYENKTQHTKTGGNMPAGGSYRLFACM